MKIVPKIIQNLETARRLSFSNFEKIILEPGAISVLVNLFLHPGCKSDINLATFFTGQPVKLSDISSHIITAFPSQLADFAQHHGLTKITAAGMLKCFALDHADAVEKNQVVLLMAPAYALAHVLTIGTVVAIRQAELRQLADLQVKVCGRLINFSHVLVPSGMQVRTGQEVFHHFGVVVAVADSKSLKALAKKLQFDQDKKSFMRKITRQVLGEHIQTIDYAKEAFFRIDMTGSIIEESKKDVNFFRLWQEDDLKKIKIPQSNKVMFQS